MPTAESFFQDLQQSVHVFHRTDLHSLEEMVVEGERTYLGEVRNFKSLEYFKKNLPKDLSISWSSLPKGQELKAHYHPCDSFLIITEGAGVSTGDTETMIEAGDIVFIPKGNLHGFKAIGENGFRALSIQFQSTAIFESAEKTETTFFDRLSIPASERELRVIKRKELPAIHEAIVNGERHSLGEVRNFSGSEILRNKFPDFFSCAWVKLDSGEELLPHEHTEESMIILTEGEGQFSAQHEFPLKAGDILYVPPGSPHGFKTQQSFWALSIQFNTSSLYEEKDAPRVQFLDPYESLLNKNIRLAQRVQKNNPIFQISRKEISQASKKTMLLDCLQVMSNHFQQLMLLRAGLCSSQKYKSVFLEHLLEELGHDRDLEQERAKPELLWDPILHASCSWFVGKNFVFDNAERLIMVQMVLEKCATMFYGHFADLLGEEFRSEHVSKHLDADEGHELMGISLLKEEPRHRFDGYGKLLEESWSILELFLRRTAELVREA